MMSALFTVCFIIFIVLSISVFVVLILTDNEILWIITGILWSISLCATIALGIRDKEKTDPTDKISITTPYGDYSIDPGSKLKFEDGSVVFISDGVEYKTNDYLIRKEKEGDIRGRG